jgi:3-oxoadipate enol-lactonase
MDVQAGENQAMLLSIDNRTIHFQMEGPKDVPCIMLSHGLGLDLSMWDGFVSRMDGRFQTLRYDGRGHGLSEPGSTPFSLTDLEADAIKLLDALDIKKVHYIGLSMGGMVGLGIAIAYPDRLFSAAICDARGDAPPAYRDSWNQRIAAVEAGGIESIIDSSVTRWFTEGFVQSSQPTIEAVKALMRRTSALGYCWSAAALRELNYAAHLYKVKIPLLFLTGSQDKGAPPDVVKLLHTAVPSSSYIEIPDSGHMSAIERPDTFMTATTEFLAKIESRGFPSR